MYWKDEGYLLSKNYISENSIMIQTLTLEHGKYTGLVYGGSSRKQKKDFQIGNKILLNWKSKSINKSGYFNIELIKPVSPLFFDDKKRSICILSATSILKILLPERQVNKEIYNSFENMINELGSDAWIKLYIYWELSLLKLLGYEVNFLNIKNNENKINDSIEINGKYFKIPKLFLKKNTDKNYDKEIQEALTFNKNLIMEFFIIPNRLKFPLFRNILEKYYT